MSQMPCSDIYRQFIDGIVTACSSLESQRIRSNWRYPEPDRSSRHYRLKLDRATAEERVSILAAEGAQAKYNEFIESLSQSQRDFVARIVENEYRSGVAAVLHYMEETGCDILAKGISLPKRPYNTDMAWDYSARVEGREWPSH